MHQRNLCRVLAICAAFLLTQSTQAQTILFDFEGQGGSGLLPDNEVGGVTSSGFGGELSGISFDVGSSVLSFDVGWGSGNGFGNLTGNATGMHIHGPADFFSNAGIKYPLSSLIGYDASASSGGFNGTVAIGAADVSELLNGLFYVNVHTADNPGGELRANLIVVPEPSSLMVLGLVGVTVLTRRRRRG